MLNRSKASKTYVDTSPKIVKLPKYLDEMVEKEATRGIRKIKVCKI